MLYLCSVRALSVYSCCLFYRKLFAAEQMEQYERSRCFLDEDFTAVEQFTVRVHPTPPTPFVAYIIGPSRLPIL